VCFLFLLISNHRSKLWNVNKKLLDPIAPRFTAISSDCYAVHLDQAPPLAAAPRPRHPKNPALGTKAKNKKK
jgi:hypothetical protein